MYHFLNNNRFRKGLGNGACEKGKILTSKIDECHWVDSIYCLKYIVVILQFLSRKKISYLDTNYLCICFRLPTSTELLHNFVSTSGRLPECIICKVLQYIQLIGFQMVKKMIIRTKGRNSKTHYFKIFLYLFLVQSTLIYM